MTFYYIFEMTDCSMITVERVDKFEGSLEEFEAFKESYHEGAEGPMSFTNITKEEYDLCDIDEIYYRVDSRRPIEYNF